MLLRSLENKAVVLWWYACEHYTFAQLGNLTYDRTNDFSKGNLGTIDLDGALWFAVVCWGAAWCPCAVQPLLHIPIRVCGVSRQE